MKKKIAFCLVCLIFLVGINFIPRPSDMPQRPMGSLCVDFEVSKDLSEMSNAPIIVIGKYVKYEREENGNRDVNNTALEDPNLYSKVNVYSFEVEQVLKGDNIPSNIEVAHSESSRMTDFETDEQFMLKSPLYVEPVMAQRCILFLRYVEPLGEYTLGVTPGTILIEDDDTLTLHTNLTDTNNNIQTVELANSTMDISIDPGVVIEDKVSGMTLRDALDEIGVK